MKALICIAIWIILTWIVPTAVIRTDRLPRGTRGIALAPFLVLVRKNAPPTTVKHEMIHVEQYRRYGWLGFYPIYFYHHFTKGYRHNPLEKEAFARQNE